MSAKESLKGNLLYLVSLDFQQMLNIFKGFESVFFSSSSSSPASSPPPPSSSTSSSSSSSFFALKRSQGAVTMEEGPSLHAISLDWLNAKKERKKNHCVFVALCLLSVFSS